MKPSFGPNGRLIPLPGSDDPRRYLVTDAKGKASDLRTTVVTFFYQSPVQFVGTGFFVANSLVVTARHVIEELQIGERPCFALQLKTNGHGAVRAIQGACLSGAADVGLVQLVMLEDEDNPSLRLGAKKPAVGSIAYTLACPNTVVVGERPSRKIHSDYEFFRGKVAAVFPEGRDRVMLPWPCFQLTLHMHPGSSGGPVFDERGYVFGVNCASGEPHTDTSYATSVDMLFGLGVKDITIGDRHFAEAKVEDFVDAGIIEYQ